MKIQGIIDLKVKVKGKVNAYLAFLQDMIEYLHDLEAGKDFLNRM